MQSTEATDTHAEHGGYSYTEIGGHGYCIQSTEATDTHAEHGGHSYTEIGGHGYCIQSTEVTVIQSNIGAGYCTLSQKNNMNLPGNIFSVYFLLLFKYCTV